MGSPLISLQGFLDVARYIRAIAPDWQIPHSVDPICLCMGIVYVGMAQTSACAGGARVLFWSRKEAPLLSYFLEAARQVETF